ncbi:MAG: RnfABCDGE type electron transport complex subunit B [Ruminococcus flavefaciens]|nr:RnfABCDGE type electron transport complex subunit B [Ruminococcus flavefaciens]MCM1229673.1 RnfABCDGE type electron transport complex subunit B [Ruminococcus flavefaciens]
MTYIIPALILGVCGILAGILLTVASKVFYVKVDERIEKISESLPQANCGACGFAGCADYADAIVNSNAPGNLCRPGGAESANKIAEILGTSAGDVIPMTAVVHCNGDCNATKTQFDFDGVQSCKAVKRFYGGNGMCKYGCIGLGDCMNVCEYNAISIKDNLARINTAVCKGCGQCANVCPNHLISVRPKSNTVDVLCSSSANGKATKLSCSNGCIGCKICEKKCLNGAIKVENFHASIDYTKCTNCGECRNACPVKAIH